MTSKVEVKDLRIERILPYIQNIQGESLDSLMVTIDNLLKFASPDAMTPGLINWGHKNLFLDKWIRVSGAGTIGYNQFGASKIGKGRYEVSGTGKFVYERLLPVSEIRGVTGRIFLGSTLAGSTVTVGIDCFDADENYLGTNGGFLFNNESIIAGSYHFMKASAFGEATSGVRFLKPNTRFVKLYVNVISNSNVVYFDESELSVFEQDERYKQIFDGNIDWNTSEFFFHEAVGDTTYVFKNDIDGRVKNLIIKNADLADINVTFPASKWQGGMPLTIIRPGRTSIFSFIKAGGTVYASVIEEME